MIGDLISRRALMEKRCKVKELMRIDPELYVVGYGYVLDAPAIDPESLRPVGRWCHFDGDAWRCTYCDGIIHTGNQAPPTEKYCCRCGARMDWEGEKMTMEEAIAQLMDIRENSEDHCQEADDVFAKDMIAIDMVIAALRERTAK